MTHRHAGRDLLGHGAGKGDKDRTQDTTAFRQALEDIDWHHDQPDGFERDGHKLKKVYGQREQIGLERGPHIKIL